MSKTENTGASITSYGRVSKVGGTSVGWVPGSGRLETLSGGGVSERRCYDGGGRLQQIVASGGVTTCSGVIGPSVIASYEYTYDAHGNREQETYRTPTTTEVTTYGYDPAERLTTVNYVTSGRAVTYTLANDGTRLAEEETSTTLGVVRSVTYQHDARGGLSGITDARTGATVATYETDASGRVQKERRPGEDLERKLSWDAAGRLVGVTSQGIALDTQRPTTTVAFGYDHRNLRISKTSGAGTARYVWGDGELAEERLPGMPASVYERVGAVVTAVGGQRAIHDGLESIVGVGARPDPR